MFITAVIRSDTILRLQSATPVSVATHHNKLYIGHQIPPVIEIRRTRGDMGVINRLSYSGQGLNVGCIRDIAACSYCNVLYMIDYCGDDEQQDQLQEARIHCTEDSGRIRSVWNVTTDT